jgi:hypothetical protein
MDRERSYAGNAFACIASKESKRVHPNIVYVHDRSQARPSIALFEAGGG